MAEVKGFAHGKQGDCRKVCPENRLSGQGQGAISKLKHTTHA